jgi:RND family efflux transporter MFP subunit
MASPQHSLDDLRIERPKRSARSGWPWVGILVLLLLLVGAVLFLRNRSGASLAVEIARARPADSGAVGDRIVLNASGYVVARREATVSSKVTGKVMEVLIEEGMKVAQGQVLARLDDTNVRASLRLAEAQWEAAKAAFKETQVRITEAEINLKRISNLVRDHISAQSELDAAQAELDSLQARLVQQQSQAKVAEQDVASWQQQLADTIIRAPFAGIVTSKNAQPGEMISPISAGGGFTRTGICTIVDMDSLEIEIDVNESYINRVSAGQSVEATLDAYPDWKIPCKVIAIIPTADRQKSTVRVRVGFEAHDPRILPQMSIKVAFRESGDPATTAARGVFVPRAAVKRSDGRDIVFVNAGGKAERRAVTVSNGSSAEALVTAGLSEGERVVLNPPETLADGAAIREKESSLKP